MKYICPPLGGGALVPLFGFLLASSLGFKARVGSALLAFCGGKCNVHSLRSTSGATPAKLLATSITASHLPTCISRDGTWLGFEWVMIRTENECATTAQATRLISYKYFAK